VIVWIVLYLNSNHDARNSGPGPGKRDIVN